MEKLFKDNTVMLAIVIPYYKLTFFDATLQSLADQADKRFKVYIGDDASPENPSVLLEKYQGKFDFVYDRFDENLGGLSLVKQWERCIALSSQEEWIMILGDDDVLGENVVEEFYKNLGEIKLYGSNVVKFASQTNDILKSTLSKIYQHPKLVDAATFYCKRLKGEVRSSLSEHVFKRKAYLKYGFKNYPLAWHSDDMAWIDFAEKIPIFSINEAFVKIRVSFESITGKTIYLRKKNEAEIQFFTDIVKTKLTLFTKEQQLKLLYQLEVSIKKCRKLKLNEWLLLFPFYIKYFKLIPFMKYIRRFLINIIK